MTALLSIFTQARFRHIRTLCLRSPAAWFGAAGVCFRTESFPFDLAWQRDLETAQRTGFTF